MNTAISKLTTYIIHLLLVNVRAYVKLTRLIKFSPVNLYLCFNGHGVGILLVLVLSFSMHKLQKERKLVNETKRYFKQNRCFIWRNRIQKSCFNF